MTVIVRSAGENKSIPRFYARHLTVAFFADVFFADFFFSAMSAPQFGSRACITPAFGNATRVADELIFARYQRVRGHQGWPFDAFFAADITPPVICLICSPALVN